jgi:hypothetical protein
VLPVVELVGVHVEGHAADLAELHVVAADAELGLGVAHRRRTVAAAARLMEHQGPMLGAQPLDQLERFIRGEHAFDHDHRHTLLVMPGLDPGIYSLTPRRGETTAEWVAGSSPAMTSRVSRLEEVHRLRAVAHQHVRGLLCIVDFVELLASMLRLCRVHDGPLGGIDLSIVTTRE